MRLYVITHGTSDYGDVYVVRLHVYEDGRHYAEEEPLFVGTCLEDARASVRGFEPDLVCLDRFGRDDPVIVESWAAAQAVEFLRGVAGMMGLVAD